MESKVLMEDYQMVADSGLPFDKYRNSSFLITGATGLIGSLLIRNLLYLNRVYQLNLRIIAIIRNYGKAEKIFPEELKDSSLVFWEQDLSESFTEMPDHVDYIIHAGANTTSRDMVQYPVDNIRTSVNGTMSILEVAKRCAVKGMVYLSSMEVYGEIKIQDHKVTEKELGYVDLSTARSCYPEGKRICECLCNAYAAQYGVHVCSARLAQTFGAGVLESENRVFAQFAKSVIKEEDIILHTAGLSEGNYVYTADAIVAILLLLTEGKAGQAYNISNESSHMTIRQMAELVAEKIAEGRIQVVYDIPEDMQSMGYAPTVKMHLSADKIRGLGWKPGINMLQAYQRMISYMKGR